MKEILFDSNKCIWQRDFGYDSMSLKEFNEYAELAATFIGHFVEEHESIVVDIDRLRRKFRIIVKHNDMNDDELFNFIAPRLEALIDTDLKLVKPYVDKVQEEKPSIEETAVFKKQLIIGDNNDGTITIMLTSQPSEDDKKMLRTLSGDENMDFKKDPEYSYWYASIKGKTPKEAEEQISQSFPDYAIEIDNDQDQIA